MNPSRPALRLILVLFGLLLTYALTIVVLVIHPPAELGEWFRPRPRKPFSKLLWTATRFGDADRYKMANDLVHSKLLIGKTEGEVRALLGAPHSEDHIREEIWLGYDLVPQRSFPSRCFLLPGFLFMNSDTWLLEIRCEKGRARHVKVRFT